MIGRFWRVSMSPTGASCCEGDLPRLDRLVGVGRAQVDEARRGPQDGEMLDRLVRGPVLADAHAVVREHVDDRQLHERGEPHGRAHVVDEHEERGHVGPQAAVRGHAVAHGGHGELAHAEVEVAAPRRGSLLVGHVRDPRVVGRRQVGRAADERRQMRRHGVDDLAGGGAGRDRLVVRREDRQIGVPALGAACAPRRRPSSGLGPRRRRATPRSARSTPHARRRHACPPRCC